MGGIVITTQKRLSRSWDLSFFYGFFLHLTLFFMLLEVGMRLPFSVFKVPFVITCVLFAALLFQGGWAAAKERLRQMLDRLRPCRWLLLFLGVYILLDLVGILYSPAKGLALTKYAVVVPMAVFAVLLVFYCDSRAKIDRVLLNVGCAGTFLALFTLFNYFVVEILPIPYYRRLSMLTDYNRFASVVFTGFLMLLILLLNSKLSLPKKYAAVFGVALVDYTVLNLCGSRRTYATLIPALVIIACYQLIRTAVRRRSWKKVLQNAAALALTAAIVFSFNASILKGFEDLSGKKYDNYVEQNGDIMEENSIDTILDSMGGEGMFAKRFAIWGLALEEAASYSPWEMLIGKGTSYETHLYDIRTNSRLNELYAGYQPKPQYWMTPHNFLLSDFLSGGLLKLAASLGVWVCTGWILLRLLRYKTSRCLIYGSALGILLINSLISGRYTYIYDKYFWIFLILMALEYHVVRKEKGLAAPDGRPPARAS